MMRGFITEVDFDKVEQAFPGIVGYYRELKEKPCTFLELLWGFTHRDLKPATVVQVALIPTSRNVAR
jgi:hypothetical protein